MNRRQRKKLEQRNNTPAYDTYFANVFGPDQFQPLHDTIANRYFQAFFDNGLFVGRMRTRLAIPGWEQTGPEASARALLQHIRER